MLGLHHDGGSLIAFCVVCACVVCSVGWWLRRLPPRHPQLLVLLSGDLGGGLAAGAADSLTEAGAEGKYGISGTDESPWKPLPDPSAAGAAKAVANSLMSADIALVPDIDSESENQLLT